MIIKKINEKIGEIKQSRIYMSDGIKKRHLIDVEDKCLYVLKDDGGKLINMTEYIDPFDAVCTKILNIQVEELYCLFPNAGRIISILDETKPNQNKVKEYKIECEYYTIRVRQIYPNINNISPNNTLYPVMITIVQEKNETKKELDISKVFGGFSFHNDNWLYSIM